MKINFLGSGSWQGTPAPFGDDEISKNVSWDTKDFRFRTSLHIQTSAGKTILVEVTPDIRLQSWKYNLKKPDAILISHWHWDHLFGLLELDWYAEKNKLSVYGNNVTKQWCDKSMGHININFNQFDSFESFTIDNIIVTPIPVKHVHKTHGFIFENNETGKKFVYLSDFFDIPVKTLESILDAESVTVDATYLESEIDDDLTHMQKNQFVSFFDKIKGPELILTNLGSYQNITHSDFENKFPNQTIAFDGMTRVV